MRGEKYQELADAYTELIRDTEVYQTYVRRRDELKQQPDLYRQVMDYRQANYILQNETPEEEIVDRLEEFERKYEGLRANPMVDRFLGAELAFCRMMQELNLLVLENLNFE